MLFRSDLLKNTQIFCETHFIAVPDKKQHLIHLSKGKEILINTGLPGQRMQFQKGVFGLILARIEDTLQITVFIQKHEMLLNREKHDGSNNLAGIA